MKRFAFISLFASLITIVIKFSAYYITLSIGILSDALESFINLFASIFLIYSVILSQRPSDKEHLYGHGKIEYLSSALEGIFILLAGASILYGSINRIINPFIILHIEYGIILSIICGAINLLTSFILFKGAKKFDSIALEADAKHLLSDVISTVGLVISFFIMYLNPEKLWFLDPIMGIFISLNILKMSYSLLKKSISGLMDYTLPEEEIEKIKSIINKHRKDVGKWHGLKTRKSGSNRFIEFHLLVPGEMSVKKSHDICCAIEKDIQKHLPNSHVIIHVEPEEEKDSWNGTIVGGLNPSDE
ncbi:cation diffusion facilitator family transporter [Desulfothermus naphthae]